MAKKPTKIARPWVYERKSFEREKTVTSFDYNQRRWRNKRRTQLNKQPCCVVCDKKGIVTVATVADHIVRIEAGGDPWSDDNIQSLCKKCHDSKSGKEAHG